jgi:hypothetical protein
MLGHLPLQIGRRLSPQSRYQAGLRRTGHGVAREDNQVLRQVQIG